jgi:tetratricopeptide (TPR) repeat protein
VAALVACVIRTHEQLGYWKDSTTVFGHAAELTTFNKFSHGNLNYALSQQKHPEPVPRYKAVLRADAPNPNTSKGSIVFDTDTMIRVDDGVIQLSELLNYDSNSAPLRNNLGILFLEQQKPDEAIQQFEQAIAANPKYPWAYFNEAIALNQLGRGKDADERYREALRLRPTLLELNVLNRGDVGRRPVIRVP